MYLLLHRLERLERKLHIFLHGTILAGVWSKRLKNQKNREKQTEEHVVMFGSSERAHEIVMNSLTFSYRAESASLSAVLALRIATVGFPLLNHKPNNDQLFQMMAAV